MFDSRARAKSIGVITGAGKNDSDIACQISNASQANPEKLESLINKINDIHFFQTCFKDRNFKALQVVLGEFLRPARVNQSSAKIQLQQIVKNNQATIKLAQEIKRLQTERYKLFKNNQSLKSKIIIKREQKFDGNYMQSIPSQGLVSNVEGYSIEHSVLFQKPKLPEQIKIKKAASQPKPLDSITQQIRKNPFNLTKQKSTEPPATTNKYPLINPPELPFLKNELSSKLPSQQHNKMLNNNKIPQPDVSYELYKQQATKQRRINNSFRLNPRLYK